MKQLTRITGDDLELDERVIRHSTGEEFRFTVVILTDPKGARAKPRRHVLPLTSPTFSIS